jgi:photosynthetic reaction center cytochrome c subunit
MEIEEIAKRGIALPMRNTLISTRTAVAVMGLMLAASSFAAAQQGAAGKTAAQVYKNIQVLKDIPSPEFIPTMRFVSAALGVECEYCHTGTRSEDTPNKQTARKMMTMMLAINKQNFDGRLEVTCYTCHKGSHDPASAPTPTGQYSAAGSTAFYRPTAPPIGATDEVMSEAYKDEMQKEAAVAAALPKPEQILARYVSALGGEQALRKVTSRVITSTTELSPNVRGAGPVVYVQETQYFKAPNLYAATFQGISGPQTAKGFDGTDAWTQDANGVVNQANGTNLDRARRDADFYESINLKQEYTRLNVMGIEKVRNHDAYLVIGVPAGDNRERLYFDSQTGLLLRKGTYNTTALGNYTIQTDYDDYRDVGGVKVPFLISTTSVSPADTTVIHVEKVDNNPTIDAGKFARPTSKPPRASAGR